MTGFDLFLDLPSKFESGSFQCYECNVSFTDNADALKHLMGHLPANPDDETENDENDQKLKKRTKRNVNSTNDDLSVKKSKLDYEGEESLERQHSAIVKIEVGDDVDLAEGEIEEIEEVKIERPDDNPEIIEVAFEEEDSFEENLKTKESIESRAEAQTSISTMNSGFTPKIVPGSSGSQTRGENLKTKQIIEARTEAQTSFATVNSGLTPKILPGTPGFQIVPGHFQTNQGSGIIGQF